MSAAATLALATCRKRGFDLVLAAGGLVLLAPLFALMALAIKLDSPGPVFFRQQRVGRGGRPFRIHKLRTMVDGAAGRGLSLTLAHDARITRVGAVLRRYRLDELAQLIDVLQGTMSLVGPRPELPRSVAHYPAELREALLAVRPGITDPAALAFRDEARLLAAEPDPERAYIERVLPAKLRLSAEYSAHASFGSDLRVLWRSLAALAGRAAPATPAAPAAPGRRDAP